MVQPREKKRHPIDVTQLLPYKPDAYEFKPSVNKCILYALGIGFQKDQMNEDHYPFTYEKSENF